MDQLSQQISQTVGWRFGGDLMSCFDYERNVEIRSMKGGTSRKSVEEQLELIVKVLG